MWKENNRRVLSRRLATLVHSLVMKRVNGAPAGVRDTEKMTFVKLSETVGGSGGKKF